MTTPAYLREVDGGLLLALKVQPRASRNELAGLIGEELKLKVTAPPVDSAANEAVVDFLAERLGLPRRSVTLVRGQTSRHKVVRLEGISLSTACERLG